MRKLSIIASFILLAPVLNLTQANAATPKLGGACSKVGSFGDTPKAKFICVKSGKKNVWAVWHQASSNNNSTLARAGFKPVIPIKLPVTQDPASNAITLENIVNRIADIPQAVFDKSEAVTSKNKMPIIPHDVFIAPGLEAVVSSAHINEITNRAMKYFAGFQQTKYFAVYVYDFANIAWAKKQTDVVAKSRNYKNAIYGAILGPCSATDCNGDGASMFPNGDGYSMVSVSNGQTAEQENGWATSGGIAHNYAHTVQFAQYIGTGNEVAAGQPPVPPFWIFEGIASATAWYNTTGNLREYLNARKNTAFNFRGSGLKSLTVESFTNYLLYSSHTETIDVNGNKIMGDSFTTNPSRNIGNQAGGLAVEALIAIYGPQAVVALDSLLAAGDNFEVAFQKVFGISWKKVAPILGQVLAAEYKETSPTP